MVSKAERTRNLIVAKSAPIFNQLGYGDTSLSTICNSTGLSKGSVYGNFKDKNELALEAFNLGVENIILKGQASNDFKAEIEADRYAKRIYSMIEGSIFTAMMQKDEGHIIEMMNYLEQMVQQELYK